MRSYAYAAEKYGVAVDSLATSTGTIQQRLKSAYFSSMRLMPDNIEERGLWQRHGALHAAMTRVHEGPGEGYLEKTLNQMSDEEAVRLASELVSINHSIQELYHEELATKYQTLNRPIRLR